MLTKLFARLGIERKASRAFSALVQVGLDLPIWTPRDYEHLTRVSYQLNADVYSCVNLIVRSAKQIPWIVYNTEGGTEVSKNHPLLKLLRKPNERDSESDFKEAALAFLLLSGNSYIERSGGTEFTAPAFLYPHRPDRFRIIKGNRRLVVGGYLYTSGRDPVRFEEWEILHLRLFNPLNDWYGMSPLEAAAYTIDNSNEAAALYKKLLQKGYPPGAVSIKGVDYTDEQIKDLKVGLRRAVEQGDILLLQDASWQEMGFKPVDASIFTGKQFQKRDIAAIFGVPSGMIGDTQVKTYANSREERRSLYTEAVMPVMNKLCEGLNNWLGPLFEGAHIDFDKDAIDALAEDREVQAKRVHLLWTSDLIRRNEGRGELKYEAVPDEEDVYYSEIEKPDREDALQDGGVDQGEGSDPAASASNRRPPIPINQRREAAGGKDYSGEGYRFKVFNLLSEEQKDNHWKILDERRELWTARIAADVEERFDIERNAVLKAYRDTGETAALRAVMRQEDAWLKLYQRSVMAVAEDFGRRTAQSIKADGYEMEVKFEQDLFTRTILTWLDTEGAKRVVGVLDTTRQAIRKELTAGVAAGESIFQLTKRLDAMYGDFGKIRAERIARTEVQTAAAIGGQTAAKATNLPLIKEWLSTRDNRVRDSHEATNGQKRPMNEPYSVSGYSMMYPCDSTLGAPASEIIQCRCSEVYSLARG